MRKKGEKFTPLFPHPLSVNSYSEDGSEGVEEYEQCAGPSFSKMVSTKEPIQQVFLVFLDWVLFKMNFWHSDP
jgi:hypothetical protein